MVASVWGPRPGVPTVRAQTDPGTVQGAAEGRHSQQWLEWKMLGCLRGGARRESHAHWTARLAWEPRKDRKSSTSLCNLSCVSEWLFLTHVFKKVKLINTLPAELGRALRTFINKEASMPVGRTSGFLRREGCLREKLSSSHLQLAGLLIPSRGSLLGG